MTERVFRVRDLARIRDVFLIVFQAAKLFTEPFEVVLRPLKAKRSRDQNARYWTLLREVADIVWIDARQYSSETWHTFFRGLLIGFDEVSTPDGKVVTTPISTTTLSVQDMGVYMRQIEQWCVEQGFPVMEEAA